MSITVQDRLLRMADVVGDGGTSLIMQQTLDVPADHPDIERIVGVGALPVVTEAAAEDGRVVVRGKVSLSLVYMSVSDAESDGSDELRASDAPESDERDHHEHDEHHEHHEHHEHDHDDHDHDHDHDHERSRRHRIRRLHCLHFPEHADFEAVVEMPEVRPGMVASAEIMSDHVAHNLVNRRRLGVDVSLIVRVKVDHAVECRAVLDVVATGADRVHLKKERVHLDNLIADERQDREVEAVLTLPDAKPDLAGVADLEAMVRGVTARAEDGRVIVDGAIDADMLYACDAVGMAPMHHVRVPEAGRFSHVMPIPGARTGHRVDVVVRVAGLVFVPLDRRMVRVVVRLRIWVRVVDPQNLELVTDVTSDTRQVDVLRRLVHLRDFAGEGGRDAVVAGTLNLPPIKPPVDSIVKGSAFFTPTELRATNGRAVIEGDLSFRIAYVGAMADLPVHIVDFPKGLHIAQQVDVPALREGMTLDGDVAVVQLDLDCADPDTVQVKVLLRIRVRCFSVATLELICDFVVVSPCPPGTSMRLVVVQPGDTLWKIARQYGTTVEEIVRLNNIENPDLIFPGQRFRIPCVPTVPVMIGKG